MARCMSGVIGRRAQFLNCIEELSGLRCSVYLPSRSATHLKTT